MKGKLVSVMLVVLALSLILTACAPQATPTPVPPKSIKVGLPIILTGADTYVFGEMVQDAATMAVEEINAAGGVLGRPLELVPMDDAGDPAQAVAVAHKLCEDPDIVAVIGHTFSGTTIPTLPIYSECGLAELELGSNPRITVMGYGNVFRTTCANDLITGYAGADYAVDEKHIKSVAVIHNKTMWGQAVATVFEKRCEELGVTVTSFQGVDADAVDFSPTLTKVNAENPEAVYFAGYSESAKVCNQMRDLGMKQLYIAAEATSSEFVDAVKEKGIGTLAPTAAPPTDFRPETRKFSAAFKARFGKDPEEWSPVYYDVVYALAAAIKQAGTTDRAAIVKALHEIEVPSIVQPQGLAWDQYGEQQHPVAFIWELQPDLQMRVVYTWQGEAPYQVMSYEDYKALVVSLLGQ
jgi:branched-chain amino acid transport system substrate-binding protein